MEPGFFVRQAQEANARCRTLKWFSTRLYRVSASSNATYGRAIGRRCHHRERSRSCRQQAHDYEKRTWAIGEVSGSFSFANLIAHRTNSSPSSSCIANLPIVGYPKHARPIPSCALDEKSSQSQALACSRWTLEIQTWVHLLAGSICS